MQKIKSPLLGLLFCVLGLIVAMVPILRHGMLNLPGDAGDTRFNHYLLEFGYQWVRNWPQLSFWDPPFFFPAKNTMAYSDVLLGVMPQYWVLRWFGLGPVQAFQGWAVIQLVLTFVSAVFFLRKVFNFEALYSFIGAYLVTFGSPRLAQFNHIQLLGQYWSLLALTFLFVGYRSDPVKSWKYFIATAFCVSAQFYSGFYLAWFLTFGLFIYFVSSLFFSEARRDLAKQVILKWPQLLGSLLMMIVMVMPLFLHYYAASKSVGTRPYSEVSNFLPRLGSWLYLGQESLLYQWQEKVRFFNSIPIRGEHQMGVGLVTLFFCLYGLWKNRFSYWIKAILIGLFIVFSLATLELYEVSIWRPVYEFFPAAKAVRVVSRIGILLLIPLAIGLGLYFKGAKWNRLHGYLILFIFLEQIRINHGFDAGAIYKNTSALAARASGLHCKSFYYVTSSKDEPCWKVHLDGMWASIESGVPTMNGYSGNVPPGWGFQDCRLEMKSVNEQLEFWKNQNELGPNEACIIQ